LMITGEISVTSSGPPNRRPVRIKISSFAELEKTVPNSSYLTPVSDEPGQYNVDTGLLSLAGGAPVVILKYQVHVDPDRRNEFLPVNIIPFWKCESSQTSLLVTYSANVSSRLPGTLSNLSFLIPVDGEVGAVHSKPT